MPPRPPCPTPFPYTTLFRSWALSAAGRNGEALAMSERAMRLGSRDPSFLYHAGMVALRAGRTDRTQGDHPRDRKSTRLNSSHLGISYAVFCLKKKTKSDRHE